METSEEYWPCSKRVAFIPSGIAFPSIDWFLSQQKRKMLLLVGMLFVRFKGSKFAMFSVPPNQDISESG